MRLFFLIIMVIHGLIHLLGFFKAFNLVQISELTLNISKLAGLLWLLAALLFFTAAGLYFLEKDFWWFIGGAAVIISQILIIGFWSDAKFGTVANVILVIPIIISLAGMLPTSYLNTFEAQVKQALARYVPGEVLTEKDVQHLPEAVQKYIMASGAIGKEKPHNFRAVFRGQFKPRPSGGFLDIQAVQYNFFDPPARIFYMKARMFGLPIEGLHSYVGPEARMRIKIASLLQVVNASGAEMNLGETVTMFNDMCLMAPATLIDKNITWETIDPLTVKAHFTNQDHTISATLFFNEQGKLINFASDDRYESADGKVYNRHKWTTPVEEYQDLNGRQMPLSAKAIWHKPEGDVVYAKFILSEIEYNCREFR